MADIDSIQTQLLADKFAIYRILNTHCEELFTGSYNPSFTWWLQFSVYNKKNNGKEEELQLQGWGNFNVFYISFH